MLTFAHSLFERQCTDLGGFCFEAGEEFVLGTAQRLELRKIVWIGTMLCRVRPFVHQSLFQSQGRAEGPKCRHAVFAGCNGEMLVAEGKSLDRITCSLVPAGLTSTTSHSNARLLKANG